METENLLNSFQKERQEADRKLRDRNRLAKTFFQLEKQVT